MDLAEQNLWEDGIYQLEQTDLVIGGDPQTGGTSNVQAQQLANRTTWLKDKVGLFNRFTDTIHIDATTQLDASYVGKVINVNSACTLTLPHDTNIPNGSAIVFIGQAIVSTQATIMAYSFGSPIVITEYIHYSGSSKGKMYLGGGDILMLVKGDPPPPPSGQTSLADCFWYAAGMKGNFDEVGEVFYSHKIQANTIHANGQLLSRGNYPRLWEYAQTLGSSLVSDSQWVTGTGGIPLAYTGCFSTGNGSTTFRVPDLRAMFLRGLDSGRGIDLGRQYNNAGGYEADDFKSHTHQANGVVNQNTPDFGNGGAGIDKWDGLVTTTAAGGTETRPKNIGLLPLIKS